MMDSPELLALHTAMHANLREIAKGESKSPATLFDQALKSSAECLLAVAEAQYVQLPDRIELLFEAGRHAEAREELQAKLQQGNWLERFLNGRRYCRISRAVRYAVDSSNLTPT